MQKKINQTVRILLLLITATFSNCQNDDYQKNDQPTSLLKTVSKEDAVKFLIEKKQNPLNSISSKTTSLNYDLDNITHEEITNSTQLLTVIPLLTNSDQEYSRVLMVSIQNEVASVLYTMIPETTLNTTEFSGTIMIRTLEGDFINGYRVKNGERISQFFPTTVTSKAAGAEPLKEVIIQNNYHAPNYYVSFITIFQMGSWYYNNIYTQLYRNNWNYGGGTYNYGNTNSGYFSSYPCDQLTNAVNPTNQNNMMPSIEWLKSKVTAPVNDKEFGVEVKMRLNSDLTYTNIYNPIDSPYEFSVALTTGGTYIGGWHSHPNSGVAMFSFADVRFLKIAYEGASDARKEAVFHGVVTNDNGSVNVYVIKVTDYSALVNKINETYNHSDYMGLTEEQKYNAIHRKQALLYRNSNGNLEKSFLEQFNGYGIQLYKMSLTSTQTVWNKRELNANRTAVNSTPCN